MDDVTFDDPSDYSLNPDFLSDLQFPSELSSESTDLLYTNPNDPLGLDTPTIYYSPYMCNDPQGLQNNNDLGYNMDFQNGSDMNFEDDSFQEFDENSLFFAESDSFLNTNSLSTFQPSVQTDEPQGSSLFSDSDTDIAINTPNYITPEEINKYEREPTSSSAATLCNQTTGISEHLFGRDKESEDSDVEEGEIVDKTQPTPQKDRFLVAKFANSTRTPLPLPQGWVLVWHRSGVPVYFHVATRAVTWSRPYFLPYNRNLRSHFAPLDSIPCLKELIHGGRNERRREVEEFERKCEVKNIRELPSLSADKMQHYFRKLWDFEEKEVINYGAETTKNVTKSSDSNHNIVEIEIPERFKDKNRNRNRWRVSLTNKTPLALLDEYAMYVMKSRAEYKFTEVTDSKKPFICSVYLAGSRYASEGGTSKKIAKQRASEATLKLVCPQILQKFEKHDSARGTHLEKYLKEMDSLAIDHPNAMMKLDQAGLPRPYQILKQCLQKNTILTETPSFQVENINVNNYKISLKIDKYEGSVECDNKRRGKNIVSQKILAQMYPSMSLGAVVKLHFNIEENLKGKKEMPTTSECKEYASGLSNKPKEKILEILRNEMLKVAEKIEKDEPISTKIAKLEP